MKTGIIILAAGNSSRLGRPKQLLAFKGNTLLGTVLQAANESNLQPIVVVLGAYATNILSAIKRQPNINYVINESWLAGMATSIAAGLSELIKQDPEIENVVVAVADQAFIQPETLKDLVAAHEQTKKNIVASKYAETLGTPVLFNKCYFDELLALKGNTGAKQLVIQHSNDTATIDFELGHIDIDTETDYNNLIKA